MRIKINDIKWGKPNNDNTQLPTEIIMEWDFDDPEHMEWDWVLIMKKLAEQYNCDVYNFNITAEEETVTEEDKAAWRKLLEAKKSQAIEELRLIRQMSLMRPHRVFELCLRKNGDFAIYETDCSNHSSGDIVNGELVIYAEQHFCFWLEHWLNGKMKNIGKLKLPKDIEVDILEKWKIDGFGFAEMADYLATKHSVEYIRLFDEYFHGFTFEAVCAPKNIIDFVLEYLL